MLAIGWTIKQLGGICCTGLVSNAPGSLKACRAEWEANHHDLHGYAAMRKELDSHFTERFFSWTPYLYGELVGVEEQEERALIEAGEIQAMGFRYVGDSRRLDTRTRRGSSCAAAPSLPGALGEGPTSLGSLHTLRLSVVARYR
jgi:hypothetical protein